jgi:hypothetical protein
MNDYQKYPFRIIKFVDGGHGGQYVDKTAHLQHARDYCMAQMADNEIHLILRATEDGHGANSISWYYRGKPSIRKPTLKQGHD